MNKYKPMNHPHMIRKSCFFGIVIALIFSMSFGTSCKEKKIRSLVEMKRDEKKAIKAFIERNGFSVREGKEGMTKFDADIFYHFDNGLYMQVLDQGEGKPEEDQTHIFVRMDGYAFMQDSLYGFSSISKADMQPIEFIYKNYYAGGEIHFQVLDPAPGFNINRFMCEGVAYPMSMLGDGARVRLIIPFSIGPDFLSNDGIPMYCKEVDYVFAK